MSWRMGKKQKKRSGGCSARISILWTGFLRVLPSQWKRAYKRRLLNTEFGYHQDVLVILSKGRSEVASYQPCNSRLDRTVSGENRCPLGNDKSSSLECTRG